jgi:hypothetical protein
MPVPSSHITQGSFELGCLPSGAHGYVLTDHDGQILFIGVTKHLDSMIKLHSKKFAKLKGIEGKINCYFIACSGEEEFLKIETNWLEMYYKLTGKSPIYNVAVNI